MDDRSHPFNVIAQLATLRRYARSLVRNQNDAEDLVQDALVRAYERKSTFRKGGNIRNWLLSIVHNTHIDRLRHARSLSRRHEAAGELTEPALAANQEHSVRLRQVHEAFFELPEEQREALHLVAIEELSYQEAADALGIPVGTLMSRISRARARLRSFESEARAPSHLKLIGGASDENR
ncbi:MULTISPECIES: sigma-70 family RNA polymerase sigma factor [unclassified Rhizobium]|uniref:sigma-70 family RNA polymerase sigma factor n=1 Tax=unclassified Rhizobium TaxID=2613769 RepID=UPI0007005DD0|nr:MULTISPECIES: sigma-70 family RNA polymerase sigma factor [unclassified Rhizobium]KQV33298.1 RNA polymerase subunit sigma [Rhizobium sp. Root1212]KRD22433.1 RNA polymerase subunit sigma [Rhizobium sp. Root268]